MLRNDHSEEENPTQEELKEKKLKKEFNIELEAMNDAYKQSHCGSNSWIICFRTLISIFVGEMTSMSSYLVMHRALHELSQETEALLLIASMVPGFISGYGIWWSTGELEKCMTTRPNRIRLDNILDEINKIKTETHGWVGYPVSRTQQSGIWSFFRSCCPSTTDDYQLLAIEDDVEEPNTRAITKISE